MEAATKTDVLIVGAGPTGLSLAGQLTRCGIDFVIVEKNEEITPYSKAIGVHARTLEIYEQIGLAKPAVEQGAIAGKGRLFVGGEVRGEFDFSNLGRGLSPYPFVLMLEQSKNERLLYEYLQGQGREVLWNTELENFSQGTDGVTARVKAKTGSARTIEARFLVGCDGPKSLVRHTLGLPLEGSTFERTFYVADTQVDSSLSHDVLNICFAKESFVVFFPLKGDRRFRIVGVFPEGFDKDEGEILYEEIESRIKDEAKLDLDIHDVEWFSTYKVHSRHVSRFSEGRCFLAGDAAHIHSPAGAQGMNTGIQDAYNLAWKLAVVIRDHASEHRLKTYNEERLENAKHLLRTTDRLFAFAAGTDWLQEFLRTNVLPSIAKYIFNLDITRKYFFPLFSQIGINYRHSSLSNHWGDENFDVKAGDRMPYFLVNGVSVYDRLRQPKFHWLVFSNEGDFQIEKKLETTYAEFIDFHTVPLDAETAKIFGTNNPFQILVRPDNHIAFVSPGTSPDETPSYFNSFVR